MRNRKTRKASKGTYLIAEMACSHEGNLDLAKRIIDGAGAAEANAIQFQIFDHKWRVAPGHPAFEIMRRVQLSEGNWKELFSYASSNYPKMEVVACVYEERSADVAHALGISSFKIHSADLSNPFLLSHVSNMADRIDLSVGASTMEEIEKAITWIRDASSSDIWLMYGYQVFPTPMNAVRLAYGLTLKERFQLPMGYQDHTDPNDKGAFWLPALAVGMGYEIIEKHITHDRSLKGVDHEAALNPDEFADFSRMIRETESAKGTPDPREFSEEEKRYRIYSKKSIVAAFDLIPGTEVTKDHVLFVHTGIPGLTPDRIDRIRGKRTVRLIRAYDLITEAEVE